jgi:hypothetical protein
LVKGTDDSIDFRIGETSRLNRCQVARSRAELAAAAGRPVTQGRTARLQEGAHRRGGGRRGGSPSTSDAGSDAGRRIGASLQRTEVSDDEWVLPVINLMMVGCIRVALPLDVRGVVASIWFGVSSCRAIDFSSFCTGSIHHGW